MPEGKSGNPKSPNTGQYSSKGFTVKKVVLSERQKSGLKTSVKGSKLSKG